MTKFSARDRLRLIGGGAAAAALHACGGGTPSAPAALPDSKTPLPISPPPTFTPAVPATGILKNTWRNNFDVGVAVEAYQFSPQSLSRKRILDQFNSITAEYTLKAAFIAPQEGVYNFEFADQLWDAAQAGGLKLRGHALLWHEATPAWMLQGSPAQIRTKLETYVTDVVTHFRGRITDWDVCNEVITDDDWANSPYRDTQWLQAVGGPEYISWAFEAARAADPDARLFLSDYSTELPGKRARLITVAQDLLDMDVPLDGIGHQMHLRTTSSIPDALTAIDDVDGMFAGLVNQVTELDISVYTDPGSCYETGTNCLPDVGNPMPADIARQQAQMYRDFFNGLALRPSVDSVTVWGLSDGDSWLNTNPTVRYNHPLLFDRDFMPKRAFYAITDPGFDI